MLSLFSSSAHLHLSVFFQNLCPPQETHTSSAALHPRCFHIPVSPSRPPLLSHISYGTLVRRHLCHCPCLISLLSRISAANVIILPCLYCSLHHIVLHFTTPFTTIVVLHLCRVSITVVSSIPASLPPPSSLNLQSPLPLELSPASPLPSFLPRFYCPAYFIASTSHHILSSHSASAATVSIIPHLHQPSSCIYTAAFYFTVSLTHHHCNSDVILSITKQ